MLSRLWCWLFGHKFWCKAYTGGSGIEDLMGREIMYYRWERQKFCACCGCDAPKLVEDLK
jgi:hypothetical protein